MKKILLGLVLAVTAFLTVGCYDDEFDTSSSLNMYTRDSSSGTRDAFFTAIGYSAGKTDDSQLNASAEIVNGNGDMISKISSDIYGIGYISLASLDGSGLKALSYKGVAATEENVLDGTYEMARNFNYMARSTDLKTNEQAYLDALVDFMLSTQGLTAVQSESGIVSTVGSTSWDVSNHSVCSETTTTATIKIGGSTSVEKVAKAVTTAFEAVCQGFTAEHNHTGSGAAYSGTQTDASGDSTYLHLGFASRDFKTEELEVSGTAIDISLYGILCKDAVVVVVNTENPLSNIAGEELTNIYKVDGYSKWNEVDGIE